MSEEEEGAVVCFYSMNGMAFWLQGDMEEKWLEDSSSFWRRVRGPSSRPPRILF